MPPALVYDCRLELASGSPIPLSAGTLKFTSGVTRHGSGSTAASVPGDTVTVDGESGATPAVLPISLTSAVAAAEAARDEALAFMFPVNITLDLSSPGDALLDF
jgi:hypothetical protein